MVHVRQHKRGLGAREKPNKVTNFQKGDTMFTAKGIVYGKFWGGGRGYYPAKPQYAGTITELRKTISKELSKGSLDAGMGYEQLLGAFMLITKKTTVIVNGKVYENEDSFFESFGKIDNEIEAEEVYFSFQR
jgi:hypothetical protein